MPKQLFYLVGSWFTSGDTTEIFIRHAYGVAASETEAKGQFMEWLDCRFPEYKQGSKFNFVATEIPNDVIRQCFLTADAADGNGP